MKTILIIDCVREDAMQVKQVLLKLLDNKEAYDIKVLPSEDNDQCAFDIYYNDPNFLDQLAEVINGCEGEGKPVISILLDVFLTTEENRTIKRGYDYIAKTSYRIFEKYGDVEENGMFNGHTRLKNIYVIGRFPQYAEYAKDLSGSEKWGYYYLSKHYLFHPDDYSMFVRDVKEIILGTRI